MSVYAVFDIDYEDKETYEMIKAGKTALVFQLESNLLKHWCKKFGPESVEEVAAVESTVRPGVLNTVDEEGVSAADHIVNRKHGREPAVPLHPILADALAPTWMSLLYQESIFPLCEAVCGWNRDKALDLLKAIAKKKMDLIVKYKTEFVADAVKNGLSETDGIKIYESLEASGRYLFSKIHAVGYGKMSVATAYHKCHSPLKYYCASLIHSVDESKPRDEVARIAAAATEDKIKIFPPDLFKSKENFSIENDGVRFGLINIGGIGASQIKSLHKALEAIEKRAGKPPTHLTWYEFLILGLHGKIKGAKISPSVGTLLAEAGALDFFGVDRKRLSYEIKTFNELSDGEYKWVLDNYKGFENLEELLKAAMIPVAEGGAAKKNRQEAIESAYDLLINPPFSLKDTVDWVVRRERELLGVNLTASRLDKFDTRWVNAHVDDFNNGRELPNPTFFAVIIEQVIKTTTKKGKNPGQEMARLVVSDNTGKTDRACVLVFPKVYDKFADLCYEGNVVVLSAELSPQGDALFVNQINSL